MSGHRNFREISPRSHASPERQQRIDAFKAASVAAMRLAEIRDRLDMRQSDVAAKLGVTQANVSRLEREEDVYLSTLRNYVSALGGTLEISAVFPEARIPITTARGTAGTNKKAATKKAATKKARRPSHATMSGKQQVTSKASTTSARTRKQLVKTAAKPTSKKKPN